MMIIQNGIRLTGEAQTAGRARVDAPRAVAEASSAAFGRGVVVKAPQAEPQVAAPQAVSEQLKKAVAEINQVMLQSNRSLEFSVDSDTDRLVVRLTDTETGEVLLQIPSEETLAISRAIGEFQQGLLLRQKA